MEQLALASIDVGRLDIAEQCLLQLSEQFPGSPRVQCVEGIYKEATESPETALAYYTKLLEEDPANVAAWKRQISVLRRMGKIDRAVEELSQFLDTFYTDVEGWLELADIYASCNQYNFALQSLSHVLLLAPQNPFYVLQAAETAYTAGDICLAIKMFLMVVDMTVEDDDAQTKNSTPTGITVRAWYGVELSAKRLQKEPNLMSNSPSHTSAPENLSLIAALAKDVLRTAYTSDTGSQSQTKQELSRWLAAK